MAEQEPEAPENTLETQDAPGEETTPEPQKMSYEELTASLTGEPPEEPEEIEEEEGGEEEENAGGEEAPPAPKGEDEGGEEPEPETPVSPEIQALREELESLKKKAANQDKFFDRMGTEVGLLRKKTPEEEKAKLEEIRDAYIEDPVKGHEMMAKYQQEQELAESYHKEQDARQRAEAGRESLLPKIPDLEKSEVVNGLAALMAEDGAPERAVEIFKSEPFFMPQDTLLNLYHRYSLGQENNSLKEQIAARDKEIEELKGKPGKMLDNIEKASGKTTLKNAGGGTKKSGSEKPKPVQNQSYEDLQKSLGG